jgi:N-acetylglucosaminyldiphosphoundecaprenol N-acetyl-beta-D-mannosaminyltransferase
MLAATMQAASIMSIDFANLDRQGVEATVLAAILRREGGRLVTANLDILRRCHVDPDASRLVRDADLVVADGTPIIWAARLARRPLPERVAGSDLIWTLSSLAADAGHSVYLLGGSPGYAEQASRALIARSPGLDVAGWNCPPMGFERSLEQMADVTDDVAAADPDIVFVGLGFPKQDLVIEQIRGSLPASWFIGVGVSIDMVGGKVRRAPAWTHRLGLEWLYRLTQEPRKLARRYLIDDLPFAGVLFGWAVRRRLAG